MEEKKTYSVKVALYETPLLEGGDADVADVVLLAVAMGVDVTTRTRAKEKGKPLFILWLFLANAISRLAS